ncbi:hypothetical protein ACFLUY_01730 [Chloroflexota bacterium]
MFQNRNEHFLTGNRNNTLRRCGYPDITGTTLSGRWMFPCCRAFYLTDGCQQVVIKVGYAN